MTKRKRRVQGVLASSSHPIPVFPFRREMSFLPWGHVMLPLGFIGSFGTKSRGRKVKGMTFGSDICRALEWTTMCLREQGKACRARGERGRLLRCLTRMAQGGPPVHGAPGTLIGLLLEMGHGCSKAAHTLTRKPPETSRLRVKKPFFFVTENPASVPNQPTRITRPPLLFDFFLCPAGGVLRYQQGESPGPSLASLRCRSVNPA